MGRSITTREQELLAFGTRASENALKDRHLRTVSIGDGLYQSRRHINDMCLPLRAHLADQQFSTEDEFVRVDMMEDAQQSCTCEMLDPEEMMIQAQEARAEMEIDFTAEITDGSNAEPEESAELSLAEYYQQLFHITPGDNIDHDDLYHGICGKAPKLKYGKSRVFGPARQAALLSA